MIEQLSVKGLLRVTALYPATDGIRGEVVAENHNLVVSLGSSALSRLLGGGLGMPTVGNVGITSISDLAIASMALGSALSTVTPRAADVGLSVTPLYTIQNLSRVYPDAFTVTFRGVLPLTACVGATISEEGLFTACGTMFAHTSFSPITKMGTHALQFDHSITFESAQ